jgi:hypothetical protein
MGDVDVGVIAVLATFAIYSALLLAERLDPQASRWPL